ncbi:aconitate hydratase, partial [candidate division KSB1 bacterium]
TDPRDLEFETPEIPDVEEFKIDDSMILAPGKPDKNVQIYRGPNIGDPPKGTPITGDISGEVMIKVGDKITTDHIMPAGARLKYRSNIPKYSEFVFEPVDPTFPERCLKNKENNKANIIVAGLSYGQGSSREHAAICPSYLNVKAVIAKSIERIHHSNLINFGILPLEFINEKDYENLESGDNIKLTDLMHSLDLKKPILIHNESKDIKFEVKYTLSDREIKIIKSGGLLQYIKENK